MRLKTTCQPISYVRVNLISSLQFSQTTCAGGEDKRTKYLCLGYGSFKYLEQIQNLPIFLHHYNVSNDQSL